MLTCESGFYTLTRYKCMHPLTPISSLQAYLHHLHLHSGSLISPVTTSMADRFQIKALWNVLFRVFTALITCTGGAMIGLVAGAIKGQTTETGLVRGAGVGAVSGAIVALDMIANGEPFSKTSAMETSFTDLFNMENNNNVARGLSEEVINDLPKCVFDDNKKCQERNKCVICLQDFEKKEEGRELPGCKHVFHMKCIDEWLMRQGSCPICRRDVVVV